MFHSILCRYNEIATKGNNRSMFEKRLVENMRHACSSVMPGLKFSRIRGRIVITKPDVTAFSAAEQTLLSRQLQTCFGLDSFSFCAECQSDESAIIEMVRKNIQVPFEFLLKDSSPIQFRTRARRGDKSFPLDSKQIEIRVATLVEEMFGPGRVKVNLTSPQITIGIEVREKSTLLYFDRVKAPGGLPVGSNAPLLALLSGGIDSPVACHMAMKRGCHVDFLTFHSFPYTPEESLEKVKRLSAILNRWQSRGTLFACNISEIQKLIRDHCDPRYRTVLYRRMMMRIATLVCRKFRKDAIVTGESVGQVASQTVANMSVIDQATPYLILRPLCGTDKNETILRAEKLGTFDTSILAVPDSCTVFAPDSPVLHARLHTVEFEESKIQNLDEAIETTFQNIQIFKEL